MYLAEAATSGRLRIAMLATPELNTFFDSACWFIAMEIGVSSIPVSEVGISPCQFVTRLMSHELSSIAKSTLRSVRHTQGSRFVRTWTRYGKPPRGCRNLKNTCNKPPLSRQNNQMYNSKEIANTSYYLLSSNLSATEESHWVTSPEVKL